MVIACQSSNVKNLGLEGIVRDHANVKAFPTKTQLRLGSLSTLPKSQVLARYHACRPL